MEKQALRVGSAVIALAILLRLLSNGLPGPLKLFSNHEAAASLLMYLGTGRIFRFSAPSASKPPLPPVTDPTSPPETIIPAPSSPLKTDLQTLAIPDVNNQTAYSPAWESLLRKPLNWDLKDGEPAVLIVHTHATESYTPIAGESYEESGAWRSLDEDYNMISIGDELARLLEETGIRVIHDRTFHDHPSYNSSYSNARRSIDSYLQQYPSIRMVLDIHRDAAQTSYGQLVTSATVGGQKSAQLMMVVGTDASGNHHPEWEENLALALKLSAVLEQTDPGITRPVNIRKERFNMDKTTGSLLIEVGAAGNTHQEAMIAVHALARGIASLAQGAQ